MASTTGDWMIEQHLCRCCHSEGKFKSLISTDPLMEDELLYLDALRFCLDIELCLVEGPLANAACTICETCVSRLQEACSFRRQVLSCEGRFQTLYSQNRIKVASSEPVLKKEVSKPDVALLEPVLKEELSDPDDSYFEDSHDMNSQYIKEEKPKQKIIRRRIRVGMKRKRPRTAPTGETTKKFQIRYSEYKRVQKNKYMCTRCSKTLGSFRTLRCHIRSLHLAENKYDCTLCDKSFRTYVPFVKHKLDEHNIDDRFKCNACDSVFNLKPQLIKHKHSFHMLGEKYKCPQCDYEGFSDLALRRHTFKHETVKNYNFASSEPVEKKELSKQDEKPKNKRKQPPPRVSKKRRRPLTAPAGDRYSQRKKPEEERKMPTPRGSKKLGDIQREPRKILYRLCDSDYERTGDKFKCTRCNKTVKTKDTLRRHIKTNHIITFRCTLCNKSFSSKVQFVKHKLDEHNIDDRFKCNACDKVFNAERQLIIHINVFHMLGEKYKCPQCDHESYSTKAMNRHMIKHKTVKDHHCKYCKKSFLRKTTLQFHERIHTGDKRKVCAECGQAFVQKASLNYHMMKYHPEVNY